MDKIDMWEIENGLNVGVICGVDEAGRGPLAGPVCAAAVILPQGEIIPGLNDSKKLTDKKRRELFPIIKEKAVAYGIAFATEAEIDEINILQATFLAMKRAIAQLDGKAALLSSVLSVSSLSIVGSYCVIPISSVTSSPIS